MNEPSLAVVLAAATIISGFLYGGVPLFKMLGEWIEAWRKARQEKRQIHETTNIEARKLDAGERDKASEEVWKLYEAAQTEIGKLQAEVAELEKGDSLSRPTVAAIYQAIWRVGRQIEVIDTIFIKEFIKSGKQHEQLKSAIEKEMEILRQRYDELLKALPQ